MGSCRPRRSRNSNNNIRIKSFGAILARLYNSMTPPLLPRGRGWDFWGEIRWKGKEIISKKGGKYKRGRIRQNILHKGQKDIFLSLSFQDTLITI